ncbi:hypothetical protein BpHYR1_053646 [Brachionus plicatilis]|uniref:Uncharacterized protein n=1 Tax=Brachionus plicatilis TaxID=10195 RepID=A0A3M7RSZ6_BRAPC|nr:hypothetical protein BpHYR1_053646 [Brachionus plicatilis]
MTYPYYLKIKSVKKVRYKFGLYFLENILNSESISLLKFYINFECRMLQLSKLHQLYSKTNLRRWPTRRSPMLQQANNLDLLRWETIFRTKKAVS